MKRTFTFLMTLFLSIGAMWAQVTSLEGFSQDKCYTFATTTRGAWAVDAAGTLFSSTGDQGLAVDPTDTKQQFAVLSANGADYYLYSVSAEKFVKADRTLVEGLADALAIADASSVGEGRVQFRFRDVANAYINLGGSNQMSVDWWGTIDAGNAVLVSEAGDFNAEKALVMLSNICTVTYEFTYEDVVKYTQQTVVTKGDAYPAVLPPYGTTAETPAGNVEEDVTVKVPLTIGQLPFVAAEDVESIETWYYVQMHSNNKKYIQYLADQNILEWADAEMDGAAKDTYAWAFVGNIFDGFKMVNKAATTANAVKSAGSGDATVVAYAEATSFVLAATSETSEGAQGGFCLRYPENNQYLNAQNGKVAHWGSTDAGSTFTVVDEALYDLSGGTWSDVTAQYLVNADFASIEGWTIAVDHVGESYGGTYYKLDAGTDPNTIEVYHTWGGSSTPLDQTKNFKFSQKLTLPAGEYCLKANGFYREGAEQNATTEKAWLFAGESKQNIVGIGTCGANNMGDAANVFKNGGCLNEFNFTVASEGEVEIGIEGYINTTLSWVILGPVTLEKKYTLKDNFMEQVMAFNELVYGQEMYALTGVQAKLTEAFEPIAALYSTVEAGGMVLKEDVEKAMETMAALSAEANAVIKYYNEAFLPAKMLAYEHQDNSTANTPEAASAYEDVVSRTYNLAGVQTVADLETLVNDLEAARQAYVVNAVPTNGFAFDYTFLVVNPNFDNNINGWEGGWGHHGGTHTNGDVTISKFQEKWVDSANGLGTTSAYQTLKNLPSGVYNVTASVNATRQNAADQKAAATGVYLFGNDSTVAVSSYDGKPELFTVEVVVVAGELTFGIKCVDAEANWVAFDNIGLSYVGAVPEEVLLPLKKEAFKERAAQFAAYPVDASWTMINNNYYWMVADAVLGNADYQIVGVLDTLDKVTSIAVLDEWMAEMDKSEVVMDEAYALGAEYNYYKNLFFAATDNSTPVNDEVGAAAGMALESTTGIGYMAGTVSDLESAIASLRDAYLAYVTNAVATDGYLFDVSFLLTNATCDSKDGWTAEGPVGTNRGQHWSDQGDNTYIEPCEWGATSWTASISQTISLPNGMYTVRVAGRASSGVTLKLVANDVETVIPAVGDAGGTIATDGTEWADVATGIAAGKSFANNNAGRGWSYVSAENAKVENGELTISVVGTSSTQYQWSSVDDFSLYCAGVLAPAEPEFLTVVGAKVGDVAIVEGVATVESISTIDVIFDRPVAKAENAGWATLADSWGPTNLNVEVLEAEEGSSEYVVRFTVSDEFGGEFTAAGDYELNIPEGFIVGAEGANYISSEITATITIEAAPATPLAVTSVTVGEDVMEGFTVVATPEDMIKVNFDAEFYFSGMPTIVNAEGNDASGYFTYISAMDAGLEGNSYILQAQNWEGTVAPAGVYTITLSKASFMNMMQWKAPAEDIVLTVEIIVTGIDNINADANAVIYDIHGRRVEKMEKGIYIVNGKKVIKK